ncbi:hypothetical protein ACOSP7_024657 [Xanthoceras sorbifolium]
MTKDQSKLKNSVSPVKLQTFYIRFTCSIQEQAFLYNAKPSLFFFKPTQQLHFSLTPDNKQAYFKNSQKKKYIYLCFLLQTPQYSGIFIASFPVNKLAIQCRTI